MISQYHTKKFYFVASNEHAAEVIGCNGWKIKTIAIRTKTMIKCPSPTEPPIFCIVGKSNNVEKAKKMIQSWADHFDEMKTKKRDIQLEAGDILETTIFTRVGVACIIGKKGNQVKKIAVYADVKIISPDINKEPIFIISGKKPNVELAIFWMKLTAFCTSSGNYFSSEDVLRIHQLLNQPNNRLQKYAEKIVDWRRFNEKFYALLSQSNHFEEKSLNKNSYNCCYCKQEKFRVAKGLCGHVLSCDSCIVELFRDIYLRCHFCKLKIENFLIEKYFY